jgi:hypothetical protein
LLDEGIHVVGAAIASPFVGTTLGSDLHLLAKKVKIFCSLTPKYCTYNGGKFEFF